MSTKFCNTCSKYKPVEEFSNNASSPDGRCAKCKECTKEYKKQYRKNNKIKNAGLEIKEFDKFCWACDETKSSMLFHKNLSNPDGLHSVCKDCSSERGRKTRKQNSEKNKSIEIDASETKICGDCGEEKSKTLFDLNRTHADGLCRICKDCAAIVKKEYYKKNDDKIKKNSLSNYEKNKDTILQKNKIYRETHKQERNERNRQRRLEDPYYAFVCNLRSRFRSGMKTYSKNGKVKSCAEYGIDFEAIYNKVGPCPSPGYELDHIIPLSLFDLNNVEHIRLAHIPENFQWLPAKENDSKNAKLLDYVYDNLTLVFVLIAIDYSP